MTKASQRISRHENREEEKHQKERKISEKAAK